MRTVSGRYDGNGKCSASCSPAGETVVTSIPQAEGSSAFTPTDLVAAGLATCMLSAISVAAERHGIDVTGAKVEVEKEMTTSGRRRIARLAATVTIPGKVPAQEQPLLEAAAQSCPVHTSLLPEIDAPIEFRWA